MESKLTLTINQSVIKRAKKYAQKKHRSLSDIIESYLKAITVDEKKQDEELKLTPVLKSMYGAFKAPENFDYDYKKILKEELCKKYIQNDN